MNSGGKILWGIIITIVAFFGIGIVSMGIWSYTDPEGYEKFSLESKAKEKAKELETRTADGYYLRIAQEINPSKLSNANYKNNAEKILSNYVLTYQGKDKSGNNMVDALNRFYGCDKNTNFTVEIKNWNNEMITLELTDDFSCRYSPTFLFGYKPQSDDLRYIYDQIWEEQVKSVMNFLDINP